MGRRHFYFEKIVKSYVINQLTWMLLIAGSVVQTLTRSLERQLSTPIKKPVGGTRVMPPSSPSPRPAIVKQRAVKKTHILTYLLKQFPLLLKSCSRNIICFWTLPSALDWKALECLLAVWWGEWLGAVLHRRAHGQPCRSTQKFRGRRDLGDQCMEFCCQ